MFKDKISHSLLSPLILRYLAVNRKQPFFEDVKVNYVINKLQVTLDEYPSKLHNIKWISSRTIYYDKSVENFIESVKCPVIIILGCGMDTRYYRINNANKAVFYELDIEEVISLKNKILPIKNSNHNYIGSSMFSDKWMYEVSNMHKDSDILIIVEGVIMYFEKEEVTSFFKKLQNYFIQFDIVFDYANYWICDFTNTSNIKNDNNYALLKCAIDDITEITKWCKSYKLVETYNLYSEKYIRWGFRRNIIRLFPKAFNAYNIAHYKCNVQ